LFFVFISRLSCATDEYYPLLSQFEKIGSVGKNILKKSFAKIGFFIGFSKNHFASATYTFYINLQIL